MSYPLKLQSRRLWLYSALLASVAFGCTPADPKPTSKGKDSAINIKDRPALEVVLVDGDFEKELSLQWQAFSEQPIHITRISSEEAQKRSVDSTDVWIYPSNLMGDMVASERIVPLPPAAVGESFLNDSEELPKTTEPQQDAATEMSARAKATIDSWPIRWRTTSRFGAANYAVPLGAPQLVLVSRGLKLDSLDKLDDAMTPQEDRTGLAEQAWNELIASIPEEASNSLSSQEAQNDMTVRLNEIKPEQMNALVDRYLWIASTTNAKRRGFFDLTKLQPRLNTPEFVLAAKVLIQLVQKSPETMLATHTEAWDRINAAETKNASLAIAMPGFASLLKDESAAEALSSESLKLSKLTFNPHAGFVVSIGKKTRQTSVAAQFSAWLSTPDQRQTLSRISDRVELWPTQPNSLLTNESLRNYHNLNNREQRAESLLLSTRFSHSIQYRQALANALKAALLSPDQSQEHLENCVREWNAITESLGILNQRKNVEQALGFGS